MDNLTTTLDDLLQTLPVAIWSEGHPLPYIYRGAPIDMVRQMAAEMGAGVTADQAMDKLIKSLAKSGRLKLRIHGSPPEDVRAGIFVHCLLEHRICRAMAQA